MEEVQQKAYRDGKINSLNHINIFPEKIKKDSIFKYQELNLKKKSVIHNLNILKWDMLERYILISFDVISFFCSFCMAQLIRNLNLHFQNNQIFYVLYPLLVFLMMNYIFGLYKVDFKSTILKTFVSTLIASFFSLLFISFIVYLSGFERFIGSYFGRGVLLGTMTGFATFSFVHRFIFQKLFERIRSKRNYLVMAHKNKYNFLLEESRKSSKKEYFDFLDLQDEEQLLCKIRQTNYNGIIVDRKALKNTILLEKLIVLRVEGFQIFSIQEFFENIYHKVPIIDSEDQWFISSNEFNSVHNPIGFKVKRIFDIVFSFSILLISMPLMIFISLLIKLESPGPVIYTQKRVGQKGKIFSIYKFRTMVVNAEKGKAQWAQKNDARITRVGKILRIMRIDELPQLWNVLGNQMSIIGPRPERPELSEEIENQIPFYNVRYIFKPGITGWAQIHYPYGASVQDAFEKLQYDFYYIKNYGLLLDLSIMIKTIGVVLFGKGGR